MVALMGGGQWRWWRVRRGAGTGRAGCAGACSKAEEQEIAPRGGGGEGGEGVWALVVKGAAVVCGGRGGGGRIESEERGVARARQAGLNLKQSGEVGGVREWGQLSSYELLALDSWEQGLSGGVRERVCRSSIGMEARDTGYVEDVYSVWGKEGSVARLSSNRSEASSIPMADSTSSQVYFQARQTTLKFQASIPLSVLGWVWEWVTGLGALCVVGVGRRVRLYGICVEGGDLFRVGGGLVAMATGGARESVLGEWQAEAGAGGSVGGVVGGVVVRSGLVSWRLVVLVGGRFRMRAGVARLRVRWAERHWVRRRGPVTTRLENGDSRSNVAVREEGSVEEILSRVGARGVDLRDVLGHRATLYYVSVTATSGSD
ncbi:hypothetical protein Tco_0420639 [Tanacetum coccineum]